MPGDDIKKHLKKLVELARKGPAFGLALGKGSAPPTLEYSTTKSPDSLEKVAKKAAGGGKSGSGVLEADGSKVIFRFEGEIPTGALKQVKALFSANGISAKVSFVSADGREAEEAEVSADVAPDFSSEKTRAARDFQELAMAILQNPGTSPAVKAKVDEMGGALKTILHATPFDLPATERLVAQLRAMAAAPAASAAANPVLALAARFKALAEGLAERAAKDAGLAKEIALLGAGIKKALTATPPDRETAERIVARLLRVAEAPVAGPEPARVLDPEAEITRVQSAWSAALSGAVAEIVELRDVIGKACDGLPGAAKVGRAFAVVESRLEMLNKAVGAAVASGKTPEAAVNKIRAAATQLRAALEKDPMLSRLDDNPFKPVRVFSRLRLTLEAMETGLSS